MLPPHLQTEEGPLGHILFWPLDPEDKLVQYQFQLIARQPADYLLPCLLRFRQGQPQVCQDVSGLTPLDQAGDLRTDPDLARHVLVQIVRHLLDAADRLLPVWQFSLLPSLVFLQLDRAVKLVFWPVIKHALPGSSAGESKPGEPWIELQQLLRQLAAAARVPEGEAAIWQQALQQQGLAGLLAALEHTAACKPDRLEKGCSRQAKSRSRQAVEVPAACDLSRKLQRILGKLRGALRLLGEKALPWLTGQTEEPEDCQTVLLPANPADFRMAMLSEGKPGTAEENEGVRAFILVDEFIVGRDPRLTDLCLPDPGVGRVHARIVRRAGSFFICDLGSKNGTRLDGCRLPKNAEQLLPEHCVLQFAAQSFYFVADGCN